jgi:RNA polymerase sigma-70 factor (subfamily 1)
MKKEDMDYETQVLINEAKLGDKDALNRLFARYQNRVLRIVRLRLNPELREKLRTQSMDIVQEIFIAALRKLNKFEPTSKGAFLHWLSKIVENYIRDQIDYFSSKKRHSPLKELSLDETLKTDSGSEVEVHEIIPSEDTSPSQYASRKELKSALDNLLLRLEDADREVIILHKLEELTFKEIAQLHNKTEDALQKQYHRAFQKLISLVEEDPIFKGI